MYAGFSNQALSTSVRHQYKKQYGIMICVQLQTMLRMGLTPQSTDITTKS